MKCPYCNAEMMTGILKSGRYIQFQEIENGKKKEEYLVAKSYMSGAKMEGALCPQCKKIIVDIALVEQPPTR